MLTTSLLYWLLVVLTVTLASNQSVPFLRNSTETLKSIRRIPVFLQLSGDSSSELSPWIWNPPVSSLVARNKCFAISGRGSHCYPFFRELFWNININTVLLVPSWPENVLNRFHNFITSFHRVPALVILSSGNKVSGKPASCLFMWISDIMIDVPGDNCLYIGGRIKRKRLSADTFQRQDRSRYLKNMGLAVSLFGYDKQEKVIYTRYPEAVAYLNALPVLNVTSIFMDNPDHADIIIQPSVLDVEMLRTYDIGGIYSCFGYGFFSRRVRSHFLNIISWSSLTKLIAGEILLGAIITASFYVTRSVLLHRSLRISDIFLFLVASSVGRSPVGLDVKIIPFRVLLSAWLLGNIVIGTYLQSQITSEYSVPAYLPAVETVEDLQAATSSGMILPCVDSHTDLDRLPFTHFYKLELSSTFGIIKRFLESDPVDREGCCKRARLGTHIYIAPMDFPRRTAAYEWDLRPGTEVLDTHCTVALARRDFRYVHQHRRVVLALAEAGFTIHEERRRTWNHTKDSATTVTLPFSRQFQVLIYGCAGSFLVFLCELLFGKLIKLWRTLSNIPDI